MCVGRVNRADESMGVKGGGGLVVGGGHSFYNSLQEGSMVSIERHNVPRSKDSFRPNDTPTQNRARCLPHDEIDRGCFVSSLTVIDRAWEHLARDWLSGAATTVISYAYSFSSFCFFRFL